MHVDSVHVGYSMHLGGTRDGQLCIDKNVIEKYTVLHGQFDTSHIPHLSAAGNPY